MNKCQSFPRALLCLEFASVENNSSIILNLVPDNGPMNVPPFVYSEFLLHLSFQIYQAANRT